MQDLRKLQHAHRVSQGELTKLQHHIKELQKATTFSIASQEYGQHSPPVQNKKARIKQQEPKAEPSQSLDQNKKGYNNLNCSSNKNRNRGFGRRGTRQMVDPPGKPEGWARLCYWCRDHVPFEKANHLVKDCPFFQQDKLDFWTSQLGYQSATSEVKQTSPETENSTTQENWKGILLRMCVGFLRLSHPTI